MKFDRMQNWPIDIKEAAKLQEDLARLVDVRASAKQDFESIAGVDVAYSKKDNAIFACAVIMKYPELIPLEKVKAQSFVNFQYVPGFMFFREGPVIAKALERFTMTPDLIMFDAHGIAHPKGIGMASQFGIMLDMPTIGCAKKRLIGNFRDLPDVAGAYVPLEVDSAQVGYVVRTRIGVKPLFVSPGHKTDLKTSLEAVLSTIRGYRLPEPLRVAHILVNKMRRNYDNR